MQLLWAKAASGVSFFPHLVLPSTRSVDEGNFCRRFVDLGGQATPAEAASRIVRDGTAHPRNRVIVYVQDFAWLDEESLLVVDEMIRTGLATVIIGDTSLPARYIDVLHSKRGFVLENGPLTRFDAAAFVAGMTGSYPGRSAVDYLLHLSGHARAWMPWAIRLGTQEGWLARQGGRAVIVKAPARAHRGWARAVADALKPVMSVQMRRVMERLALFGEAPVHRIASDEVSSAAVLSLERSGLVKTVNGRCSLAAPVLRDALVVASHFASEVADWWEESTQAGDEDRSVRMALFAGVEVAADELLRGARAEAAVGLYARGQDLIKQARKLGYLTSATNVSSTDDALDNPTAAVMSDAFRAVLFGSKTEIALAMKSLESVDWRALPESRAVRCLEQAGLARLIADCELEPVPYGAIGAGERALQQLFVKEVLEILRAVVLGDRSEDILFRLSQLRLEYDSSFPAGDTPAAVMDSLFMAAAGPRSFPLCNLAEIDNTREIPTSVNTDSIMAWVVSFLARVLSSPDEQVVAEVMNGGNEIGEAPGIIRFVLRALILNRASTLPGRVCDDLLPLARAVGVEEKFCRLLEQRSLDAALLYPGAAERTQRPRPHDQTSLARPTAQGALHALLALNEGVLSLLSKRERTVILGILAGKTAAQVGASLGISRRTVESHVGHAYAKIKVHNRKQLRDAVMQ